MWILLVMSKMGGEAGKKENSLGKYHCWKQRQKQALRSSFDLLTE